MSAYQCERLAMELAEVVAHYLSHITLKFYYKEAIHEIKVMQHVSGCLATKDMRLLGYRGPMLTKLLNDIN